MNPSDWDDWSGNQFEKPKPPNNQLARNNRYRNAYSNYNGGYGPRGGFRGPPGPPGPPGPFGPPFPPGPWGFQFDFQGPGNFGPPGPNFMKRRGPGPAGPPPNRGAKEKAIKYLIRCGMTKQNVKNLPWHFLRLITPEHCGVCAMDFDTFALSRIHYGSKNHLKNQKKWITQFGSDQFSRPKSKEIPLKARELYCELCDVQITSKSHAEAHYAGKPHRAIVDGRKIVKNPFLNQPGMQGRVEMLIRREKKHQLKAEEESPAPAAAAAARPTPPELYCDICKTSMTCTEQMAMHLNGKKHLAKEKSHIWRMMKGGGDAQAQGNGNGDQQTQGEVQEQDTSMDNDASQDGEDGEDDEDDGEAEGESFPEEAAWAEGGGEAWDNADTTETGREGEDDTSARSDSATVN